MPQGCWRAGVVAVCLVLAAGAWAEAQSDISLNRAGSGARAAGMADAFIAVSDDGTAASWNPAGLAQLRQPEFSIVYGVSDHALNLSALRSPDDRFAYSSMDFGYKNASIEFASAAIPFSIARKPVTLQVGWQRLYQLSGQFRGRTERSTLTAPPAGPASALVDDQLIGDFDVLSVAGAVKLTGRASVGASLNFWQGGWTQDRSLVEEPGPDGTSAFVTEQSEVRVRGHNVAVGLLLTYPAWTVGLVYHSPFWSSFRFHGDVLSTQTPPLHTEAPAARFRLPRSIGLGLARRLPDRWTVAAGLTHDQWTDSLLDDVPGAPGAVNFFDGLPPSLSTTRDTLSFSVGLEHLFVRDGSVIPLRLGLGWEPQGPMDPVTRDPVNYYLAAAGVGYNTNSFKLDAAVQLRWGAYQTSSVFTVGTELEGGLARDAIGRTSTHEWRIKVSGIYRIPDTEKLRVLIRRIFG